MKKILVLSDSHSALNFMFRSAEVLEPDAIIHLGDYYDDGEALHAQFPEIPFYQVPGNCDFYRCNPAIPQILVEEICGVRFYLTHGHRHDVKMTRRRLEKDARDCGAQAALYGHTHIPDCRLEEGMWILNPGTCGYGDRTGALIKVDEGEILSCEIIHEEDLT